MVTVEAEVPEIPEIPDIPAPPEPQKVTITLLVVPEGGGTVNGEKTVEKGATITVAATPSSGYTFSGWSESGSIVSTSERYTFTATSNRTLTAVFDTIGTASDGVVGVGRVGFARAGQRGV